MLRGNGDATFAAAVNYPTGPVPKGVAIADMSGDGKLDILAADTAGNYPVCCKPGGDQMSLLLGTGTGTLATDVIHVGMTPFAMDTGDIDRDGESMSRPRTGTGTTSRSCGTHQAAPHPTRPRRP